MKGYDSSSYGDAFADVYDDWYPEVTDVGGTVDTVAELATGGSVLELGVGTGRVALPLAERGLSVVGVDASAAMLERLRAKPGSDAVRVELGDMARRLPPGPFDVVLATYNTFFNLTEATDQRRCLAMAHDVLRPGGRLVLETFVPTEGPDDATSGVTVRTIEADRVVLTVSRRDERAQRVDGQMVELTTAGVRLRPWSIRYLTPAQLDAAAAEVGLVVEARHADWRSGAFDPDGAHQVVRYRRPVG